MTKKELIQHLESLIEKWNQESTGWMEESARDKDAAYSMRTEAYANTYRHCIHDLTDIIRDSNDE